MTTKDNLPGDDREAGNDVSDIDNLPADIDSIPQQLRRRREASLRLPPLADGYRDPLDTLAGDR